MIYYKRVVCSEFGIITGKNGFPSKQFVEKTCSDEIVHEQYDEKTSGDGIVHEQWRVTACSYLLVFCDKWIQNGKEW